MGCMYPGIAVAVFIGAIEELVLTRSVPIDAEVDRTILDSVHPTLVACSFVSLVNMT